MWTLLAVITGTLTVMAVGLVLWEHRGNQQMEECLRSEGRVGDGAAACRRLGDFHG